MSRFFGKVNQNGYVVRDIDAALKHWTEVMGVGPFYYVESVPIDYFSYKGVRHELETSVALGNTGDLQTFLVAILKTQQIVMGFLSRSRQA